MEGSETVKLKSHLEKKALVPRKCICNFFSRQGFSVHCPGTRSAEMHAPPPPSTRITL